MIGFITMKKNIYAETSTEELVKKEKLLKGTLTAFVIIWILILAAMAFFGKYLFIAIFGAVALTTLAPTFINLNLVKQELTNRL